MSNAYVGLERFLEVLPGGILIVDSEDEIVAYNSHALDLLEIQIEDLLVKSFSKLVVQSELLEALDQIRTHKANQAQFGFELDGKPIQCSICRVVNQENGLDDVLILLEDATKYKQMEMVKREFVQDLLHKLRDPLTTLKTTLSILATDKLGVLPSAVGEVIAMSRQEVDRLNSLLVDLRNLFFIETGLAVAEMEPEQFNAMLVVERALTEMGKLGDAFSAAPKRVKIEGNTNLSIYADFEKTKLVLFNLLKNAMIFSAPETPVHVSLKHNANHTIVEVCDNGCGIGTDQVPFLFTKYFRENNEHTREMPGNGLGLYLVKSLVELMNGTVRCESKPGKGSRFFVSLPDQKLETRLS